MRVDHFQQTISNFQCLKKFISDYNFRLTLPEQYLGRTLFFFFILFTDGSISELYLTKKKKKTKLTYTEKMLIIDDIVLLLLVLLTFGNDECHVAIMNLGLVNGNNIKVNDTV
jgi:hypothetical protein